MQGAFVIDVVGDVHHAAVLFDEFICDGDEVGVFVGEVGFGEHVGGAGWIRLAGDDQFHCGCADADDIAGLEGRGVDEFAVETGAVGAVEIADLETAVVDAFDDAMGAAGAGVGDDEGVGGVAANGCARLIQLEVDLRGAHENFEIGTLHS